MTTRQELDEAIAHNNKQIAMKEKLDKLTQNPEFKEIILEAYLKDHSMQMATIMQDPNLTEKQQQDTVNMAAAPGHLKRFLNVIHQMGVVAEDSNRNLNENFENLIDERQE